MASVVWHAATAGLPVCDIAAAASTLMPAFSALDDRSGALCLGLAAVLVACDEEFCLGAVMERGQWLRSQWLDIPGKA